MWVCFPVSQFSHSVMSNSLWPHGLQHARPPCPSPTPGVYSNSCLLSWWYQPTISSFVIPFSSHLQKKTRLAPLNGIGTFAENQLPLNVKFISGFPSLFPSPPNGIFIVYFVPETIQSTNSFTPQSNSVRWALFSPLLYRWSSWDNDFRKLVSGRPRTWT